MSLIKEATIDDQFRQQVGKIQDAISKLNDIVGKMNGEGSMHKVTATQRMQLRYMAEDLKKLHEKSQ